MRHPVILLSFFPLSLQLFSLRAFKVKIFAYNAFSCLKRIMRNFSDCLTNLILRTRAGSVKCQDMFLQMHQIAMFICFRQLDKAVIVIQSDCSF